MRIKDLIEELELLELNLKEKQGERYKGKIIPVSTKPLDATSANKYLHARLNALAALDMRPYDRRAMVKKARTMCNIVINRYKNILHCLHQAESCLGVPTKEKTANGTPLVFLSFIALAEAELVAPDEVASIFNLIDEFELRGEL